MQYKQRLITLASAALLATAAFAQDETQEKPKAYLPLWQDNSITLLAGNNYKLDPSTQQTLTFEHASGWTFGDLFFFVDGTHFDGDKDINGNDWAYYGEFAPRFSAGKILNKDLSFAFIKDVNLATCWEFGKNTDSNYLIGPGFDLDIPTFDFFQLNLYQRFERGSNEFERYQVTTAWKYTLPLGKSAFVCDGFMDWVFGEGTTHVHFCPQLKFDVGVFAGIKERKLFAGIEYDYWKNKYGVASGNPGPDSDQNTFSWILKYHF